MAGYSSGSESKYWFPYARFVFLIMALPFTMTFVLLQRLFSFVVPKPLRWEWDNAANPNRQRIDTTDIHFPANFLWGASTAAHQIEGNCTNNNWWAWEKKGRIFKGHSAIYGADHWNRTAEDVRLMKDLALNSYRFSIEWSKIEPQPGKWDKEALKHYSDEIDLLLKEGITPVITLHHFTQPIWFDDLGGWENEDNLEYFYRFSEKVYEEYSDRVKIWCTFNEPTVFAMVGWLQGSFPPGKNEKGQLWNQIDDAVTVLCNMLKGHTEVYKRLKAIRNDSDIQIGIVHNVFNTHPYRRWNPIDYMAAYIADLLQNDLVLAFFKYGKLSFQFPVLGRRHYLNIPEAPHTLDFFGLNFYSHMFYKSVIMPEISLTSKFPFVSVRLDDPIRAEAHPQDASTGIMTDMEYPIYAEGFYVALKRTWNAVCKHADRDDIPIYVTENGVADHDDSRRKLFIKRYIYAMSMAMREGVDIRGYFYWTLMDNFEWAFGYSQRFGLYEVDLGPEGNGLTKDGKKSSFNRKLRAGAEYYRDVVKFFRNGGELRAQDETVFGLPQKAILGITEPKLKIELGGDGLPGIAKSFFPNAIRAGKDKGI
ncbi:hypothetical protein MIR68_004549 [Amoeboaphelidium protococcarum]|nr:hypothetical protein MIR68_004549 [Amoeboaphelidium protococcarum]KAI3654832.1 hypothetical protein MP228_000212 [Amoeboaphelidium protococcarum]